MCLPKPKHGLRIIILAGLLLLLLPSQVFLSAGSPVDQLQQILQNYELITLGLQKDFENVKENSISLGGSIALMQSDIKTLQQNWQKQDQRLVALENLSSQDKTTLDSSPKTIDSLQSGYASMERDLKKSNLKADIAVAAVVTLSVLFGGYLLFNPP
ncbi:MAG: hypothetical protein PHR27_10040 [Candidatus Cloacimonetes bacterium]|nr:hypothetical protein [Candidatus Cloacimonadota bacterium]